MKNHNPFKSLGHRQKYIINKMVIDDFYILKTTDIRDMWVIISLIDEHGNHERDLTEKELKALYNRDILVNADVSKCLDIQQEKFMFNETYVTEALNACN